MNKKSKYRFSQVVNTSLRFIITFVALVYILFPFLWLLLSGFKLPVQLFISPPEIWPNPFVISNYIKVLQDASFIDSVKNSVIVASFTTVFSLIIGTLGAYAYARISFRGKQTVFLTILGSQMIPFVVILIPLFIVMRKLNLIDKYLGLILSYGTFSVPYAIWLLQAFFRSIPVELDDAARVDGCTRLGSIIKIILPLSAPGLIATGIFIFIGAWNQYIMAVVLSGSTTRTFPVRMAQYIAEDRFMFEEMYPAAILGTLPVLILVLVFQKYIVKGLTEGGIKF